MIDLSDGIAFVSHWQAVMQEADEIVGFLQRV